MTTMKRRIDVNKIRVEIHTPQPGLPGTHYVEYAMGLGGRSKNFKPAESYWSMENPVGGGAKT